MQQWNNFCTENMRMALYGFAQYVRGEYSLDRGHDKSDDFGVWNIQIGQGEHFLFKKKQKNVYLFKSVCVHVCAVWYVIFVGNVIILTTTTYHIFFSTTPSTSILLIYLCK